MTRYGNALGPVAGLWADQQRGLGGLVLAAHSVGGVSREGEVQVAPGPNGRLQQPSSTNLRPLRVSSGWPLKS